MVVTHIVLRRKEHETLPFLYTILKGNYIEFLNVVNHKHHIIFITQAKQRSSLIHLTIQIKENGT